MNRHRWTTSYDRPVSYDGCDPDIGGVLINIREGDAFLLDLASAERLVTDLDVAIFQAQQGTDKLLALLDPAVSDDEAHAQLDRMNEPEPTRHVTGPLHRHIVCDDGETRCTECGHTPRLSEPYCQVTA